MAGAAWECGQRLNADHAGCPRHYARVRRWRAADYKLVSSMEDLVTKLLEHVIGVVQQETVCLCGAPGRAANVH